MLEPEERKRYSRQILVPEWGMRGQERVKAAKILVVGAGGLGCPVLQYLTAAGVGEIGIIDDDVVDMTNLHRQILYSSSDVGKSKALTAVEKLSITNPFVRLNPYNERLTDHNARELFSGYDLVIDGSDNFLTRYLVNDICVELDKPFVFGSILRFEGQVSVFNYKNGPTYRCLFPDPSDEDNCAEAGVIGILPGMIGTYMANEALKIISGAGESLSGKLLVINALTNNTSTFQFSRVVSSAPPSIENIEIPKAADPAIHEISWEEFEILQQTSPDEIELIDVREYYEFEADNFGGQNIPLSDIPETISSFSPEKTIVFYCNSGIRSLKAAKMLVDSGFYGKSYWGKGW